MSAHNRTLCLIRLAGHPIRAANRAPSLPGGVLAADRPVASGLGKVRGDAYRRRLLAPLPRECKCRLAGTHSPVLTAPNRPDFGHAHRPLSARYPAEHRNRVAAV